MGTIDPTDCTITELWTSGVKIVKVVTPSTADDGDTIDMSSYFTNGCFPLTVGASDGANLGTMTSYTTTVTLPGSTDDEERTIILIGD